MREPLGDEGGPAFPFTMQGMASATGGGGAITMYGMSLRDWFAGQALAGIMANSIPGSHHNPEETVRDAYHRADLMLVERMRNRNT